MSLFCALPIIPNSASAIIEGKAPHREVKKPSVKQPKQQEKYLNLLVDIQAKLQQGKGKGYEQWAKIFNLKQMAQTVNFLQEHKLLAYSDLEEKGIRTVRTMQQKKKCRIFWLQRRILTDFWDWNRSKNKKKNHRNSGKLHCDFISSQRERSHTIYCVFNGDWGYSPTSKSIRWSPVCPACHFCLKTI